LIHSEARQGKLPALQKVGDKELTQRLMERGFVDAALVVIAATDYSEE